MKAMIGSKATVISVIVIALCAVIGGIAVNLFNIPFNIPDIYEQTHSSMHYVKNISGIVFGILIAYAFYNRYLKK